jgi:signal transduction histidine kinase/ligand-binding sensor domain-containing protein
VRYLLLFTLWYCASSVFLAALDPSRYISQYGHTAWRVQDGSVDPAAEITQTADGYLWLGTSNGLLRFDGIKFVRYAPPGLNFPTRGFTFLLGARDGSLWIGTTTGLQRLKDGRLQSYSAPNERIGISAILEDDEGTIWITRYRVPIGQGPLCRVQGDGLHCYGEADGISVHYGLGLTKDKTGNLWFGSGVLYRWRPGSTSTYLNYLEKHHDAGAGVLDVAAGPSGEMWAAIDGVGPKLGLRHFSGEKWEPFVMPGLDGPKVVGHSLLMDRNQSLWIGTDKGLYRVHDGVAEHFGASDGLSGNSVGILYEDREGNIWACTDGGLDMFHDTPAASYSSREGLVGETYAILGLRDSSVWIGTDHGIYISQRARLSALPGKELSGASVTALFQDHRGVVWIGANNRLLTYSQGRLEKVLTADGDFSAISEDTAQNIWAVTGNHLLFRINNGIAQQLNSQNNGRRWTGLLPDPAGGAWIVSVNGSLTHYRDQEFHTMIPNEDSSLTGFGLMADIDKSVLEFTSRGVFRWDGRDWKVLDSRNGLPCDVIYSALTDSDEVLWLYSQCGLVKVDRSELEKWRHDAASKLAVQIFDKFDGVHPGGPAFPEQPIASKAADGKLWFVNLRSAWAIDPKQPFKNSISPPVHIEKILADQKDYAVENGLRLPALSGDVEIDYVALSFAVPQKVRFRYMLEGHDREWQDAGTRRQVFYNDLPPRNYRFRVLACNNSGIWNDTGATLNFVVLPAYYQTTWFRALCIAAFLGLLLVLYQLRIRRLQGKFAMVVEVRVDERTRIARELHDTVLQSLHGLLLSFQRAANLLPDRPVEAKERLEGAIAEAAKAITEGREAVQGLRASTVVTNDLAVAIRTLGEELAAQQTGQDASSFDVAVEGTPRDLNPILRDDVYRIAGEALRNAFQHAQARRIEVEIQYDKGHLRLRVRDDGKGVDSGVFTEGRSGHWGLQGMRERAKLLGGQLEIWSELNSGTEIQLTIPASIAYLTGSPLPETERH